MKVLILHSSFALKGGAEAYIEQLGNDLSDDGIEFRVLCGEDVGIDPYKRSDHWLIRYKYQLLDIFGFYNKKLVKSINSFSPDLIHIHNWARLRSSTISKISRKYPTILTVHDFYLIDPSGICSEKYPRFVKLLISVRTKYLVSKFRNINFHFPAERTKSLFKSYSRILPSRFTVYPLNLNFSESTYTIPKSMKNLGYLGQLEKHKGIVEFVLQGFDQLCDNLQMHIAGDGSQKEVIVELASRTNLVYHGWLDSKGKESFFETIAWLVFTSEWPENFPLVCCEALSKGRPIITAENCIPPMANPEAMLTFGINSNFRSVADVLSFVSQLSHGEYSKFSEAALSSRKNFRDFDSRSKAYLDTISRFKIENA